MTVLARCLAPLLFAALPLAAAPAIPAVDVVTALTVPLDAPTLARLPREAVIAIAHGQTLHCEGVALAALLQQAGAMPRAPLRSAQLARRVEVAARDGYRGVFALAELDPSLGHTRAVLVDRCEDRPLAADDGPLRLIVPDEARPARWIRQIATLQVIGTP